MALGVTALLVVAVQRGGLRLPPPAVSTLGALIPILIAAYIAYVAFPRRDSVLLGFSRLLPVWIKLRGVEGARHVVVLGATGSGKTETVKRLVNGRRDVLVLDWAGEYDVEPTVKPENLSLAGLSLEEVVEAVSNAFQLTVPQSGFLYNTLKNVEVKDLKTVIERLQSLPESGLSAPEREIRAALLRRLTPCEKLFAGSSALSVGRVDLSHLTHDGKVLTLNVALRMVYNLARRRSPPASVVVVEEAQNVIPARREGPPSSGELLLQEMRKYGVSVVLSAQLPTVLSEYYRDAEYIIVHRLMVSGDEYRTFSVLLDEEDFQRLTKLKTGEALVLHRGSKKWVRVFRVKRKASKAAQAPTAIGTVKPVENGRVNEELKGSVEELKKALTELTERVEELRSDLKTLFQMVVDVQSEVEGLEPLKGLEKRLEAVEEFKEGLEKVAKEGAEKAIQRDQRYEELVKRVEELNEKVDERRKTLDIAISELPKAFQKLREVNERFNAIEAKVAALRDEVFSLKERKDKAAGQIEALSKQVEWLSARLNELESARKVKSGKKPAPPVDASTAEAELRKALPALFTDPPVLTVADAGDHITVSPSRYLGAEAFKEVTRVVNSFGGRVERDDRGPYWVIPKR